MYLPNCCIHQAPTISSLSIYEIIQILGVSAFDKTPIKELLTETQFNQDVKEQYELFDFEF